ncbi:MAG: response regulator [Elusimicrobia bacterium]|nr:response regulator [Elusimicrobiota bacterium]
MDGQKTILVAEDEEDIRDLLKSVLERAGYNVVLAEDGKKALASVREKKPDLIILDLMLPFLSGWEVCVEIKRDPKLSQIPVIVLTATSLDQAKLAKVNADDYLAKPCSSQDLTARVAALLKKSSSTEKAKPDANPYGTNRLL